MFIIFQVFIFLFKIPGEIKVFLYKYIFKINIFIVHEFYTLT